jgi:hypothetical protein
MHIAIVTVSAKANAGTTAMLLHLAVFLVEGEDIKLFGARSQIRVIAFHNH